jgi:DNA (cytosine-5)-methyltransferase 1
LLKHYYPDTTNYGDVTDFTKWPDHDAIDLIVGGSPCQSFSVAGRRLGLDDPRGNLTLTYLAVVERYKPCWVVWENVPGVLSDDLGRTFGAFLGILGQLGYGFAYRILDAQFFGVPQRRRRVFVVGHLGDWRRAAAVLFERESLSWNPAPSREERKDIAPTISARTLGGGGLGTDFDCDEGLIPILEAGARTGKSTDDIRAGLGIGEVNDPMFTLQSGKQHAIAFDTTQITHPENRLRPDDRSPQLAASAHAPAVAFKYGQGSRARSLGMQDECTPTLSSADSGTQLAPGLLQGMQVRRLTPRECERLQGFPDDYTLIPYRGKPVADGPRYKALGNSFAVPVVRWIGQRIQFVDSIVRKAA